MAEGPADLVRGPPHVPFNINRDHILSGELRADRCVLRSSDAQPRGRERNEQGAGGRSLLEQAQGICGATDSAIEGEGFSNLIDSLKNIKSTVPVGPFLCFARMSWALLLFSSVLS